MVNVRLLDDRATIYSQPDANSPVVAELGNGVEFGIGGTVVASGAKWCNVSLADGRGGYVVGTVKIYRVRQVSLNQSSVDVLASPAAGSPTVVTYQRGDRFTVAGVKTVGDATWVEVRTLSGAAGFVPGGTKIAEIQVSGGSGLSAKAIGKKNLVRGLLWLVGGILVTAVTYAMAASSSGGGTYFIAWGAIIFGGIRFVKGLISYLSAPSE